MKLAMLVVSVALIPLLGVRATSAEESEEEPEGLEVRVEGIRDSGGEIGAAVFNKKIGYPTHLEHAYEAEWQPLKEGQETAVFLFDSLPPGEYAVSVLHDENGNRELERSKVGFPREGVGFSNGQKVTLRAPRYKKSKFQLAEGEFKQITIPMDYRHAKGSKSKTKKKSRKKKKKSGEKTEDKES